MPAEAGHLRLLLGQISRTVERPVFVKVGANDGVTGDPCGEVFLKNPQWTGILIEPVPHCVNQLRSIYGDRSRFMIEPVAVGSVRGTAKFYYVSEEAKRVLPNLPSWYDQLGSFNPRHIVNHDLRLEPFIRVMDVTVEPLQEILQRHRVTDVAVLHIDTEGHDLHVLQSVDLSTYTPLAIWVEHKHLSQADRVEMRTLLESSDYDVWNAGEDFFAVHREAPQRMHRRG